MPRSQYKACYLCNPISHRVCSYNIKIGELKQNCRVAPTVYMKTEFSEISNLHTITVKIHITNEARSKLRTCKSSTLWFLLLTQFSPGHQMDCVAIWRSGTTYSSVRENITSPPHSSSSETYLENSCKKRTNEPVHELVINWMVQERHEKALAGWKSQWSPLQTA